MARQHYVSKSNVSPEIIAAYIGKAHQLRSQAFIGAIKAMARILTAWNRPDSLNSRLESMPDHVKADLGLPSGLAPALFTEAISRDELSLSPAGSQAAPAFRSTEVAASAQPDLHHGQRLAA